MQYRVKKDEPSKHWTVGQTVTMTEGEASEWLANDTLEAAPPPGGGPQPNPQPGANTARRDTK